MEDEECRDVYAHYGAAAYFAQVLEKGLVGLILILIRRSNEKLTRAEFEELESALHKKPLGALLTALQARTTLTPEDMDVLERANETRKRVIHHYWWDRVQDMYTKNGRERMKGELEDMRSQLDRAQELAVRLSNEAAKAAGMDPTRFAEEFRRLMEEARRG